MVVATRPTITGDVAAGRVAADEERAYLTHLQRATDDGVPVKGYFEWSAQDNLEWIRGFGNRYGIVYVDFATQKRTPKISASFFREVAHQNALV
jgi:beta-glucosidase